MIISSIILKNFRSYTSCEVSFERGLNVIVGENGFGKTNLVEAIHYLSLTKSFRTSNDLELIKHQTKQALIEAELLEGDVKRKIRIIISNEGKIVLINDKKIIKLSELSKLVNVIVFEPSDVSMFKDTPGIRRKFIDISVSKQSPIYLDRLIIYQKLLKERNELLKGENINNQHLDIITSQLIISEKQIVVERIKYVKQLNQVLQKIISPRLDEKYSLEIQYKPFANPDETFFQSALNLYQNNLDSDIKRKTTQVGIHREDIRMMLNGKDVGHYGSQGENRLAALSLKLAPYYLVDNIDKKPIIILDDVMSELDKEHQNKLINIVNELSQVFITATDIEINNATYYEIDKNKISRRNS